MTDRADDSRWEWGGLTIGAMRVFPDVPPLAGSAQEQGPRPCGLGLRVVCRAESEGEKPWG